MTSLSYDLHKLTARLDRAADRLLRDHEDLSYSRFLALFAIREGAASQRALADWLGQTEPSTSRMVGLLAEEGLLKVTRVAGAGNRRHLELTAKGAALVKRASRLLEGRFVELVKRSGVSYVSYQRNTQRLLSQLDADTQTAPSQGRAA
jgi:DNA-binding MarR family transcriptional regulator